MLPMSHDGRRLLPPIFILNIGHNQSTSRIVTLTFLTKSVSNESAFFVQRTHPYGAFLHNYIRTKFTAPTAPTAPNASTASIASTPSGGPTILVLEPIEQSTYSLNYRAVTTSLSSLINLFLERQNSLSSGVYIN